MSSIKIKNARLYFNLFIYISEQNQAQIGKNEGGITKKLHQHRLSCHRHHLRLR